MRRSFFILFYIFLISNLLCFAQISGVELICIDQPDESYVSIDRGSSSLIRLLQKVDELMQDNESLVHNFLRCVDSGLDLALEQEVLNVLYEADAFISSELAVIEDQKRDALMDQIEVIVNQIKYGTRSSLSLPRVVGFEALFGNAASLYVAADTSATVVAGTTDRTNATSVVLASDTAATFGAGTTAFRGWRLNKNASTAELAFNYQNTDTVGQVAVPEYTVMQLDALNNQVQLPAVSTQLVFAGDTNLYRQSANVLKTDDNFVVGGLTSAGVVHNDISGLLSTSLIVNADVNASAGIVDTKLATIATAGKVSSSATTATSVNTANAIVARNASGNFSTNMITIAGTTTNSTDVATKAYVDSASGVGGTNLNTANATAKRDNTGSFAAQIISLVDGVASGNISLADSVSASVGTINKAGVRFIHNYGTDNVFAGRSAGNFTMSGTGQNVGVGVNTLVANTTGAQNVAIGYNSLAANTIGSSNSAIGYTSMAANTTGINNTVIGNGSSRSNITGSNNTAAGSSTFSNNSSCSNNTAVGYQSMVYPLGNDNVGIGYATFGSNSGTATGTDNVGVGRASLSRHTTGIDNTGIGSRCLEFVDGGSKNTAAGYYGLKDNVGEGNTAVGYYASQSSGTVSFTTAIGNQALSLNSVGHSNTAIGQGAGSKLSSSFNTAMGQNSLNNLSNGVGFNAVVGQGALSSGSNSAYVTAFGAIAGSASLIGNNNVFVGYNIGSSTTTGINNIYIDGNSLNPADESDVIRIGNTQTACYIAGIYSRAASGGVTLFVNSSGKLGTTTSSRRFKHDIEPMEDLSNGLYCLNPVTFIYNDDETESLQYGLIAEEVDEVFPGLVVREDDGTPLTVRYEVLPALLLNEIKKQNLRLKSHEKGVESLADLVKAQCVIINDLKKTCDAVRSKLDSFRQDY